MTKHDQPDSRKTSAPIRACLAAVLAIAFATPLVAFGRPVPVLPASSAGFADTESVTNTPLGSVLASARFLRVQLALTASPSNNVEVAFGADRGGKLAFGEESFILGWDCGSWFVSSPTNRIEGVAHTNSVPRTLSFEVRVAEDGTPLSWTVAPTGGGAFTNLPAVPPAWTFSREWTIVRLAVRGVDVRDESVSVRLDADPGVLILR